MRLIPRHLGTRIAADGDHRTGRARSDRPQAEADRLGQVSKRSLFWRIPSPGHWLFVPRLRVGLLGSKAAERVLEHRFPGQLLKQTIEALFLIPKFGLFQYRGHWQTDRAAAIDHGIIAVSDQSL